MIVRENSAVIFCRFILSLKLIGLEISSVQSINQNRVVSADLIWGITPPFKFFGEMRSPPKKPAARSGENYFSHA